MVKTHSQMVAARRQATLERGQKLLDNPNLSPENRAMVEQAVQGLTILNAPTQASKPSPPVSPPLGAKNALDVIQSHQIGGEGVAEADCPTKPAQRGQKWIFLAVAGVSVFLILISPNWQSADPEAQLGLIIYGPVIAIIFACMSFLFFDFLTQRHLRRDLVAKFSIRPVGASLDILLITLMMGFLGLIFLSGIGFGPEKSNLFIFLPLAIIAVWVLQRRFRQ